MFSFLLFVLRSSYLNILKTNENWLSSLFVVRLHNEIVCFGQCEPQQSLYKVTNDQNSFISIKYYIHFIIFFNQVDKRNSQINVYWTI